MEEVVLGYDGPGTESVGTQDWEGDPEVAVRELDLGGDHDDCEFERVWSGLIVLGGRGAHGATGRMCRS